ncbi:MAG TPA: phosphate acyltransferase PlsX [bacterium]
MTVIAVDAMGGDFAPRAIVEGAARASREPGMEILLVGDQDRIAAELRRWRHNPQQLRIHHTPDVVGMDDAPTAVLRERPKASIRLVCELVKEGKAQAAVSAGNSGAFMVAAKHVLGTLPGIDRPAIATTLPLKRGATVLIDSGANVDCKPHYLVQFGTMGTMFARRVLAVQSPRVGLLNNGTEPGKGNELARAAFDLLQAAPLGFVGNVEARDLFRGKADVIVCDGYVGNLVLKSAEAVGAQMRLLTKESLARSPLAWLGYLLVRGFAKELAKRTDYHQVGGSPLLGLKEVAIVCHGSSSARTILAGVRVARQCVEQNVVRGIAEELTRAA